MKKNRMTLIEKESHYKENLIKYQNIKCKIRDIIKLKIMKKKIMSSDSFKVENILVFQASKQLSCYPTGSPQVG